MFRVGDKVKIIGREAFIENVDYPTVCTDEALDQFYGDLEQVDFSNMVGTVLEILDDPYWAYSVTFEHDKYPITAGWFTADELVFA